MAIKFKVYERNLKERLLPYHVNTHGIVFLVKVEEFAMNMHRSLRKNNNGKLS